MYFHFFFVFRKRLCQFHCIYLQLVDFTKFKEKSERADRWGGYLSTALIYTSPIQQSCIGLSDNQSSPVDYKRRNNCGLQFVFANQRKNVEFKLLTKSHRLNFKRCMQRCRRSKNPWFIDWQATTWMLTFSIGLINMNRETEQ